MKIGDRRLCHVKLRMITHPVLRSDGSPTTVVEAESPSEDVDGSELLQRNHIVKTKMSKL